MALGWNTAGSSTYVKVLHLGTYALCHAGAVHRFLGLMDVSVEGHPPACHTEKAQVGFVQAERTSSSFKRFAPVCILASREHEVLIFLHPTFLPPILLPSFQELPSA